MNTEKINNLEAEIVEYNSEIASLEAKIEEYKGEIQIRKALIFSAQVEDRNAARAKAVAEAKLVDVADIWGGTVAQVKLVVVHEGRKVEYSGRSHYSGKKMITVGKAWDVLLNDEIIGTLEYRMFTRESRSGNRNYVNARWESPGWGYTTDGNGYGYQLEATSKKDALERIVRAAERRA